MAAIQQKEKTNSIDISNMLNDVNKVLHNHLTNILTPMLQEKQNIQKILLNMPMVKQLQDEHLKAQQAVYAIQAEAKALKVFYDGEIASKNERINNLQAELVKTKEELLLALKQAEKLKNVTLEVKEIEKPQTPPINITNDSFKNIPRGIQKLGPSFCYREKLKDQYRMQIVLKSKKKSDPTGMRLHKFYKAHLKNGQNRLFNNSTKLIIDVNPVSLFLNIKS